jgi:MFS family permease
MEGFSLGLGQAGSLLGNRPFRRLLMAQFCAVAAAYALSLASIVRVEEHTHSSVQTALVILAAILPAVLGSLVAGPVVDRLGWVRALVTSNLAQGLVALGFWGAALLLPSEQTLPALMVTNAALALLIQFAIPAEMALLPDVAGPEHLMPANSLLQLSLLAAEGLGVIILSPLLIKMAGVPAVGLAGALLCFSAVALVVPLFRFEAPSDSTREQRRFDAKAWLTDLQTGWRAILHDRFLLVVVLEATLAAALLLVLLSVTPGLITRHLGLAVEDASFLLLVPGGLGFLLGAILVSRWERLLSRQGWIVAGLIGVGLGIVWLAAVSAGPGRLWLVLPLAFGIGLFLALVVIPARTVLQERSPASLRGRVIATQLALANAVAVLPLLMGSTVADQVGIRPVMVALGLLTLGAATVGLLATRQKR